MGKLGAEDLVLAEKQEESGREDASDRNGFRTRTPSVQTQGLAPGPVISDVLLERVQFMKLKVGDMAPDFTLLAFDGKELKKISLHDYRGKKNVALAFFVFAFTGG